jgi:hypothetical protein
MYKWDNKYTNEIYRILCGECYRGCQQSPYKGCDLTRGQEQGRADADEEGSSGEEEASEEEQSAVNPRGVEISGEVEPQSQVLPSGSANFSKLSEFFTLPVMGKKFWIKFTLELPEGQERITIPLPPGVTEVLFGPVDESLLSAGEEQDRTWN